MKNGSELVHPISFEEFQKLLSQYLQIDERKLSPDADLFDNLKVDSIQLVDLMLNLEQMGIVIPLEAAWDVHTVRDVYQIYLDSLEKPSEFIYQLP